MNHKAKRIVFLTGNYYEQCVGGAEYQSYLVATEALRLGYKVHYIFISNRTQFNKFLDIKLHPIPKIELAKRLGIDKIIYFHQVWKLLKDIQPDLIYQRAGSALTGIAARFAKEYDIKMIWHIASDNDLITHKTIGIKNKLTNNLDRIILNYGIKKCDVILAQSFHQKALLERKFERFCDAVIYNGHPSPEKAIKNIERVFVLWVGSIKPLKQPEIFLQLTKSIGNINNVTFCMLGRVSSLRGNSELLSEIDRIPNLECLGEIPNDEVNKWLSEAHILVNTSRYEGFSNTFIQAWLRKVPVVSLNVDPDGILCREKIGFYSKTFENLCKDVELLIKDRILREKMGARARRYALRNHTEEKMVERVTGFFQ